MKLCQTEVGPEAYQANRMNTIRKIGMKPVKNCQKDNKSVNPSEEDICNIEGTREIK